MFTIITDKIIYVIFIKFFRNIPENGVCRTLIINFVSQPFCLANVLWSWLFSNFITGIHISVSAHYLQHEALAKFD